MLAYLLSLLVTKVAERRLGEAQYVIRDKFKNLSFLSCVDKLNHCLFVFLSNSS